METLEVLQEMLKVLTQEKQIYEEGRSRRILRWRDKEIDVRRKWEQLVGWINFFFVLFNTRVQVNPMARPWAEPSRPSARLKRNTKHKTKLHTLHDPPSRLPEPHSARSNYN